MAEKKENQICFNCFKIKETPLGIVGYCDCGTILHRLSQIDESVIEKIRADEREKLKLRKGIPERAIDDIKSDPSNINIYVLIDLVRQDEQIKILRFTKEELEKNFSIKLFGEKMEQLAERYPEQVHFIKIDKKDWEEFWKEILKEK